MKKLLLLSIVIAGCLLQGTAFAEKTNIPNTYPLLGRGVRPLGMGNAFITMNGSDENALFYNPASIRNFSNETTFTTGVIPPQFEFNYSVIQLTKDIFDFADDLDNSTTSKGDTDLFEAFVDKHTGQFYSFEVRAPIIGAYNRYFAVSLISDDKFGTAFRSGTTFPSFEVKATSLSGVAIGTAYGLFEERLQFGVTAKVLYGLENEQIITTSDILTSSLDEFKWSNWKRGLGIGADVGVKYEIHDFDQDWIDTIHPVVAVTYQNIGDTKFRFMKKNGAPEKLPQSVSAGIGFHPVFGDVHTSLMVDFREINIKEAFLMKLNAGAEARFPMVIGKPALRGGLNQGYPTGGVGFEIWKLVWNMAFFGKEVGETTRQRGGYRLANEFTWRF